MKSAQGYSRCWRLNIFFIFSSGGHLVYRSKTILATLVGNHLGNISLKFESYWPYGSGELAFDEESSLISSYKMKKIKFIVIDPVQYKDSFFFTHT